MLTTILVTGIACYASIRLLPRCYQYFRSDAMHHDRKCSVLQAASVDAAPPVEDAPAEPVHFWQMLVTNGELRTTAIVALGSATALTHIALGLQLSSPLFLLNGVGYAVLLTGRYFVPALAPQRTTTHDLLASYTATTLVLYGLQRGIAGLIVPIGTLNKLVEVSLLGLLLVDKASWTHTAASAKPPVTVAQPAELPVADLGAAAVGDDSGELLVCTDLRAGLPLRRVQQHLNNLWGELSNTVRGTVSNLNDGSTGSTPAWVRWGR